MYMVQRIRVALTTLIVAATMLLVSSSLVGASPVVVGGVVTGPFPYTISQSTPVQYYVSFGGQHSNIPKVCLTLSLAESNGFDYLEQLRFQVPGGTSGVVVTNLEQVTNDFVLACFTNPVDTALFNNGSYAIRVFSQNGSVTVSSASAHYYLST